MGILKALADLACYHPTMRSANQIGHSDDEDGCDTKDAEPERFKSCYGEFCSRHEDRRVSISNGMTQIVDSARSHRTYLSHTWVVIVLDI